MTDHTPGPWHISKAGHHTIWNDDEVIVADCDSLDPRQPPADQIGANCYLIAAAPDLLEALKDMFFQFEHHGYDSDNDKITIDQARAAIAKATSS